ncbi:phage tail tape measure protein [Bacillaceae bacterium Marseille-Q3522]|nr:phage tail tape measure protein [Bacillaceae bacterium Marseille-Q3522]
MPTGVSGEIGALRVTLGLNSIDFTRGMQNANRRLSALNAEFKTTTVGAARFDDSLDTLKNRADILTRTMEVHRQKVAELRRQYEQSRKEKGEDADETIRLAGTYNRAVAAMNRTQDQLTRTTSQINDQSNAWKNLSRRMGDASESLGDAGERMNNIGQGMTAAVSLPLAGIGFAAGKAANGFDAIIGRIQSQLDLTAEKANDLANVANDVWKDGFGESLQEAGDAVSALYNVVGDIPATEMAYMSKGVLTLAKTFDMDMTESVTGVNTVMKNFNLSGVQALDMITYAAQNTSGVFRGDMADALTELAPTLHGMGATGQQAFELMIQASKSGMENFDALSSLTQTFTDNLISGSEDVEESFNVLGGSADEMWEKYQKGNASAYDVMVATTKALGGMDNQVKRNQIGAGLFGDVWTEAGSDAISSLGNVTGELADVQNASGKAGKAINDNFGARAQKIWRDFQSDMKPVGEDLLDIAEDILPKVADVVGDVTGAFADMPPEARQTILVLGGIAAAAGPVVMGLGSVASGAGSLLKVVAPLTEAIGLRAGLAGALSLLTNPVGLTIAGLGLATVAVVGISKAYKGFNEVSFETLEAKQKEIQQTDELIARYEDLSLKNKLSNDEMLEFLDIQSLLASTASPDKIAELTDKQNKLLEKSGFTNEEMNEFLSLNQDIIDQAPDTEKAISDQGNAFASNTDQLKLVNEEKLRGLKIDAEAAISNNIEKENDLLEDKQQLIDEINNKELARQQAYENITSLNLQIAEKEREIDSLKGDQSVKGQALVDHAERELQGLQEKFRTEERTRETLLNQLDSRYTNIDTIEQELKLLDENKYKYESIILATVGLNAEKGKGLATVQLEIAKLEQERSKLEELHNAGKIQTEQYEEQVGMLDSQIGKLQGAQTELKNVNSLAGKTVYKDIVIDDSSRQYANELNDILGRPIRKSIFLNTRGPSLSAFASGTRNAPEGFALVGERGPELVHLPKGARVIPNHDTEAILRKWNIPMMATGGLTISDGLAYVAERGREVIDLTGTGAVTVPATQQSAPLQPKQPVVIQVVTPDERELARWLVDDITDLQQFNENRFNLFEGR